MLTQRPSPHYDHVSFLFVGCRTAVEGREPASECGRLRADDDERRHAGRDDDSEPAGIKPLAPRGRQANGIATGRDALPRRDGAGARSPPIIRDRKRGWPSSQAGPEPEQGDRRHVVAGRAAERQHRGPARHGRRLRQPDTRAMVITASNSPSRLRMLSTSTRQDGDSSCPRSTRRRPSLVARTTRRSPGSTSWSSEGSSSGEPRPARSWRAGTRPYP